jgi:predicted outer membrane protein
MKSRNLRITLCGALALAVTACAPPTPPVVTAPQAPVPTVRPATSTPATQTESDLTETAFGPISPTARKLLTIVEQTSLREITTSTWAQQRSSNPAVREAARVIITQHKDLENRDTDISTRMNLPVPAEPAPDMQAGIDRMRTEFGETFDRDYVNTLRKAHADALILVSTVRADTRNSLVRPFADLAGDYIKTHINLLEKTGDVDYAQLPVPNL